MNIFLPDALMAFVDEQVATRKYGTSSEYIHELIRQDQERQKLFKLLDEGAESPQAGVADDDYFGSLHARARSSGRE
jgi:antitoxin ParD1/3/4